MALSRRTLLSQFCAPLLVGSPVVFASHAFADTASYLYDPLGRLIRVTLSDGAVIMYQYDAAGNRTRVTHGNGADFNQTLQITGTGPINLRTVADMAGYTGLTNAAITFQVGSAVTISGAPGAPNGGYGIDTGTWPSSTKTIALTLQVSGKVYGGGGRGEVAGEEGVLAGAGGDAVYCREHLTVGVNSGGQIKGGGGGGGTGGGWTRPFTDPETGEVTFAYNYGGGGGGGFPNGPGGSSGGPGGLGGSGTASAGGVGGSSGVAGTRTCGAGGIGGAAAAIGATGANASGSSSGWSAFPPSTGGAPGYAIRKNGKTVPVTNNGIITGTQG